MHTLLYCMWITFASWLTPAVIWWPGAQAPAGWPDGGGGSEVKGHLRLQQRLPRRGRGLWGGLRHLPAHTRKRPIHLSHSSASRFFPCSTNPWLNLKPNTFTTRYARSRANLKCWLSRAPLRPSEASLSSFLLCRLSALGSNFFPWILACYLGTTIITMSPSNIVRINQEIHNSFWSLMSRS